MNERPSRPSHSDEAERKSEVPWRYVPDESDKQEKPSEQSD